jgi:hypothetical protein
MIHLPALRKLDPHATMADMSRYQTRWRPSTRRPGVENYDIEIWRAVRGIGLGVGQLRKWCYVLAAPDRCARRQM